jgi:hypothetical protein
MADERPSAGTADAATPLESPSQLQNDGIDTKESRLGFREWLLHEPIAVVVMLTLLSVVVRRAADRIGATFIDPAVQLISTAWLPSRRVQSAQNKQVPASSLPCSPADPVSAVFASNFIALVLDLTLGFLLVYWVYSMLVRSGLHPRFGSPPRAEALRHIPLTPSMTSA